MTDLAVDIDIERSFSRLNGVFVTLFKDKNHENAGGTQAGYFGKPMGEVATQTVLNTDKDSALQSQFQMGCKLYPGYPIASLEEASCQLGEMLHKRDR